MTFGVPYTLEENTAIILYQETHPSSGRNPEEYWQDFVDWVNFFCNGYGTPVLMALVTSTLQQTGRRVHMRTQHGDGGNILPKSGTKYTRKGCEALGSAELPRRWWRLLSRRC